MRLHKLYRDYIGRVNFRERPFPLEIDGGEAAPRDILEQEWWLAAIQEQLGLKVEAKKAATDILVIDRADRPSEN